jgi:catechol 2,3-dioxygenase-like lactoylglutathione lyase family enzyme
MSNQSDEIQFASWTICVGDLEQSLRFYCEGLGFKAGKSHVSVFEAGSDEAVSFGFSNGLKTEGTFLSRPGLKMRLVHFTEPPAIGGRNVKPNNAIGPRSMIFLCPNPRGVAKRLEQLGGTIIKETSARFDAVIIADPDGFCLQLEALPIEVFDAAFEPA